MDIIRSGCGVHLEIHLTAEELRQAYLEQQHLYDVEDVRCELDCSGDWYADKYDIDIETITLEEIEQIAKIFRDKLNDSVEADWHNSLTESVEEVLKKRSERIGN